MWVSLKGDATTFINLSQVTRVEFEVDGTGPSTIAAKLYLLGATGETVFLGEVISPPVLERMMGEIEASEAGLPPPRRTRKRRG